MKKNKVLMMVCLTVCLFFVAAGSAMAIPAPPGGASSSWELSDLTNNDAFTLKVNGIDFNSNQGFAIYAHGTTSTFAMVLDSKNFYRNLFFDNNKVYTDYAKTNELIDLTASAGKFSMYFFDDSLSYNVSSDEIARDSVYTFKASEMSQVVLWHDIKPSAVPVPAAVWLLGSGLVGLVGIRRKRLNK